MHTNFTLPTNWPVRSKFGDWKMGKRNHSVFCRKEDPKEQQYSRSYLIWAMCQIWMSCCSYWAPSATAPEIEKIKHHMPRSNKLLLDANVALIMKAWSMWMHKRELQQVCSLSRWEEMAVLNVILRKSRQSYMSISIPYSYCRF